MNRLFQYIYIYRYKIGTTFKDTFNYWLFKEFSKYRPTFKHYLVSFRLIIAIKLNVFNSILSLPRKN